jgi:hypothetical protein
MGEAVPLPHGYWVDGRHCREVCLRGLTGRDEEYLNDTPPAATATERATDLLARCVLRMEGRREVTREAVAGLVAGDREALIWHLRRLTLGERLQTTLDCPAEDCGKPMDLTLDLSDLLQPPYADPRQEYASEREGLRIRFRLPTGLDLEQVCRGQIEDEEAAAERLLARCILGVWDGERMLEDRPSDLSGPIPALMEELDPQAELLLDVACPECGRTFTALLDAADYLLRETAVPGDDLYHQVHSLALHYHWSEAEILGLSPVKRRRYLELLSESLSEVEPL